jgi:hypothetical protein
MGDSPSVARCRTNGAHSLSAVNSYPVDKRIFFRERDHKYWYDGTKLTVSATGALKIAFDPDDVFDSDAVVDKWFSKWVRDGHKSEYHLILKEYTAGTITKAEAKEIIKDSWSMAAELGTEMHRLIELVLNLSNDMSQLGEMDLTPYLDEGLSELVDVEFQQFLDFAASEWVATRKLVPIRTELSVVWVGETTGLPVCAGQIDGLMAERTADGAIQNARILDWKRVKPKKKLTQSERAYKNATAKMFPHIPVTDFHKYSFQASIYSVMLKQSHGIDTENRLNIIRMHGELDEAQIIDCHDYRAEALELLEHLERTQMAATADRRSSGSKPSGDGWRRTTARET